MIKQKYLYVVIFTGFELKPVKISGLCSTKDELVSAVSRCKHSSFLTEKKYIKIKDKLAKFSENEYDLSKTNVTLQLKQQSVTVQTQLKSFDVSYDNSQLVECVHSGLRKYCESKASWGLWQAINYIADNKKDSKILDLFWSNLLYSWRIHSHLTDSFLNSKLEDKNNKLTKSIKSEHLEELDHDVRSTNILKNDDERALWFMMLGLYDSLPDSELKSLLEGMQYSKIK